MILIICANFGLNCITDCGLDRKNEMYNQIAGAALTQNTSILSDFITSDVKIAVIYFPVR